MNEKHRLWRTRAKGSDWISSKHNGFHGVGLCKLLPKARIVSSLTSFLWWAMCPTSSFGGMRLFFFLVVSY